jgi:hypothetical protein
MPPLLKNEWVEMDDPAPPHRRTHGGTSAGVLALVKPFAAEGGGRQARLYKGQASPATIATGGPMGCGSRPCARAKPLAARYITHSKFNRAQYFEQLPSSSMRSRSRVADQPAQEANPTFSSATYGTEASATIVNRRFDEVYQLAAGRLTLVVVQDPMRSCGSLSIVRTQCGCTVSISCNGL